LGYSFRATIERLDEVLDHRRTPRFLMVKGAEIAFKDASHRCVALDLSTAGARVYFAMPGEVPDRVTLRLPDGSVRDARRVWQEGEQIGFEFSTGEQ
jgi:PilZ domain